MSMDCIGLQRLFIALLSYYFALVITNNTCWASSEQFEGFSINYLRTSDLLSNAKSKQSSFSEKDKNSDSLDVPIHNSEDLLSWIRNFSWTNSECDLVFTEIKTEIPKESPLVLNLFEPVDFHGGVHPCLEILVKFHQQFLSDQSNRNHIRRSLDWMSGPIKVDELLIYLWMRRTGWQSFKPNYWEDITPPAVQLGNYSKMVATMMRNRTLIHGKRVIHRNLSDVASISINLLELMHPINWRFDLQTNRFFTKNMQYRDTLRPDSLESLRIRLRNKAVSKFSDELLEKYHRDKKLLYCSEKESELLKKKISRDVKETLIQLKLEYNLSELILSNFLFSWEKHSLEAFKVIHRGEVRDLTHQAIRNLHSVNGISPEITNGLIDLLGSEGLIKP